MIRRRRLFGWLYRPACYLLGLCRVHFYPMAAVGPGLYACPWCTEEDAKARRALFEDVSLMEHQDGERVH